MCDLDRGAPGLVGCGPDQVPVGIGQFARRAEVIGMDMKDLGRERF